MPIKGFLHHKKRFKIPIYHGIFDVIVSSDFNQSAQILNFIDAPDVTLNQRSGLAWDLHPFNGITRYAIFLTPGTGFGIVAHECAHIVRMIFKHRGLSLDLSHNDEHFTYFLQYLVTIVEGELNKYHIVRKA